MKETLFLKSDAISLAATFKYTHTMQVKVENYFESISKTWRLFGENRFYLAFVKL